VTLKNSEAHRPDSVQNPPVSAKLGSPHDLAHCATLAGAPLVERLLTRSRMRASLALVTATVHSSRGPEWRAGTTPATRARLAGIPCSWRCPVLLVLPLRPLVFQKL
jgi:hypothetical protein